MSPANTNQLQSNFTAGVRFPEDEYTKTGKADSEVFRSADGQRKFRINNNSIQENHAPGVPHGYLEMYDQNSIKPKTNNHIPFCES